MFLFSFTGLSRSISFCSLLISPLILCVINASASVIFSSHYLHLVRKAVSIFLLTVSHFVAFFLCPVTFSLILISSCFMFSLHQMEPHLSVWFRAVMVFSVEVLWLVGICCLIGYYAFLHPDRDNLGTSRNTASWRS